MLQEIICAYRVGVQFVFKAWQEVLIVLYSPVSATKNMD